jgi:uncharacterized membrane protein
MPDRYWSLSVYDRKGRNLFSLNDRSAGRPDLDLVIIERQELETLGDEALEATDPAIIVDLPIDTGFVLFRAFVPGESARMEAEAALAGIACASLAANPLTDIDGVEPDPDADGLEPLEAGDGGLAPQAAPR